MKLTEKTLSTETIYEGKIITLNVDQILLPDGKQSEREYFTHPGGVCVLPLGDNNEVTMVRQYRYPYHADLLEAPAGKLSPGEEPLECGRRELLEETGIKAREYISLGCIYPTPGYTDEIIYIYLARGLEFTKQALDPDEFVNIETYPLDYLVQGGYG